MTADDPAGNAPANFDTRAAARLERHHAARRLLERYNRSASTDADGRADLLNALLGQAAPGVWIEPPFFCDYGENIHLGRGVFINTSCVFLDGDRITIGEGTLLGPAVQVYATTHPLRAKERMYVRDGLPAYHTLAQPVTVGRNVWIGGGAILMPGISVGDGATIAAGSVVTKDIPPHVLAAGNPCQVIRSLQD